MRNIKDSEITTGLEIAIARTLKKITNDEMKVIIHTIEVTFPSLDSITFKKAINYGTTGKFGRTYELSAQEICFWIRETIKNQKEKILKL